MNRLMTVDETPGGTLVVEMTEDEYDAYLDDLARTRGAEASADAARSLAATVTAVRNAEAHGGAVGNIDTLLADALASLSPDERAGGTADVCDPTQGYHFSANTLQNFGKVITKRGHRVMEFALRLFF